MRAKYPVGLNERLAVSLLGKLFYQWWYTGRGDLGLCPHQFGDKQGIPSAPGVAANVVYLDTMKYFADGETPETAA